jgi:hypothetical protein
MENEVCDATKSIVAMRGGDAPSGSERRLQFDVPLAQP